MLTAKFAHPQSGNYADVQYAADRLTVNADYEVERVEMGGFHTSVWLKDIPGAFNSVQFDFYEDGKELDIYHDPRFNPYI